MNKQVAILTIGLGLLGVLYFVAGPSSALDERDANSSARANDPTSSESERDRRIHRAFASSMRHRDYDPANVEARPDDWNELGRDGRVARTEESMAGFVDEIDQARDPATREALRERALKQLSTARADFFADESGEERYLELEASLEASE